MLQTAKERQFRPRFVCCDSWYSSLENLKAVRGHGWHFLTRLKSNRQVNPDDTENVAVTEIDIAAAGRFDHGRQVHLKGYGFIVERAQVRKAQAQKCHILLSMRAFVRLEAHRLRTGISGYAAKVNLIREAIRLYLSQPSITLGATA